MPSEVALIADIEADTCRLALSHARDGALTHQTSVATSDYSNPAAAIEAYLARFEGPRPQIAALALACPITDGRMKLTNSTWEFCRDDLEHALGLEQVLLVNDHVAKAAGVAGLTRDQFIDVGPEADFPFAGITAVVGPGSGLGVAAFDHDAGHSIIASEAGHGAFAPETDFEMDLMHAWRPRLGHITREHVISARGLVRLYRTLSELSGHEATARDYAEIAAAAARGERLAEAALETLCGALVSFAGDVALMFNARRVVLTGAVAAALESILLQRPIFRARFERRGPRAQYLERTPLLLARDQDLGLIGARTLLSGRKHTTALH